MSLSERCAFEGASTDALEVPEEPDELRRGRLRAVLDGGGWDPAAQDDVGGLLWGHWRSMLEAAGMDDAGFAAVVAGARRELWLWLFGERQWEPVVSAVAGRARRRLPGGA